MLNTSATVSNTIYDMYGYISKLNKYKTAQVLLILDTKTNQSATNLQT